MKRDSHGADPRYIAAVLYLLVAWVLYKLAQAMLA
jgi:hypothetical protein